MFLKGIIELCFEDILSFQKSFLLDSHKARSENVNSRNSHKN